MAYHKIDADSVNSITNALDLFTIPPTNVSVSSAKTFEILPSNPLTDVPYHFHVHSSQNYIDLSKCYLFTEFRIRKENDQRVLINLPADEHVAAIQMIGNTFINNMRISINGREIFNSNSLMAYKSYLTHEFSMSPTAKLSHLTAAGYIPDWDDEKREEGAQFNKRKDWAANSDTMQCISSIDADLFCQPLLLVNHCELDIEILPNDSKFVLIAKDAAAADKYHFEVLSCKLYIKKVSLMDGLALDIARKIETRPVRYAVRKSMMKALFVSAGRYEFNANLFNDIIPRRVVMGLVSNEDYVGNIKTCPFNFRNFNVNDIGIIANGRQYPQAPYNLDYPNDKFMRAYYDMNQAIGFTNSMEGNGIPWWRFKQTHCVYVFNLTNSGDDHAGLFDLIRNGTTAVSIKFSAPVPAGGVVLIVMGEVDSLIMLDRNRTIASDNTI